MNSSYKKNIRLGIILCLSVLVFMGCENEKKDGELSKETSMNEEKSTKESVNNNTIQEGSDAVAEIETRNELQKVVLVVDKWNDEGFFGTMTDDCVHDVFKEGDEIYVYCMEEDLYVEYKGGDKFFVDVKEPNMHECEVKSGSKIEISFYSLEYKNVTSYVIYARNLKEVE